MAQIDLKILDPRLTQWGFPNWGSTLAAGLDLFACLDTPLTLLPQVSAVLIPAGFAMVIGDGGLVGLIYPRSGHGHKRGLVLGNSVGVIDADYQGPILISAWNRDPASPIIINPGDRIAQMVFTRIVRPCFTLVDGFAEATSRASGGFGSTGQ